MHFSCIVFGASNLRPEEVKGKKIIDVGSHDHNGNFYSLFKNYDPSEFIGTDLIDGSGVDVVCPAEKTVEMFGAEKFDIVLSSELLEHVRDWREVVSNLKRLVKKDGLILLTTRSKGFALHAYPYDYWRYEIDDMKEIFSDMEILKLENDSMAPGVFIKMRKPEDFKEKDLADIKLYSMIENKRIQYIDEKIELNFLNKFNRKIKFIKLLKRLDKKIKLFGKKLIFGSN